MHANHVTPLASLFTTVWYLTIVSWASYCPEFSLFSFFLLGLGRRLEGIRVMGTGGATALDDLTHEFHFVCITMIYGVMSKLSFSIASFLRMMLSKNYGTSDLEKGRGTA